MMVLLQEVCKMQNFEAIEAVTGRTALKLAITQDPDLVLRYEDLGAPVHVGEGAKVAADLRLIPGQR